MGVKRGGRAAARPARREAADAADGAERDKRGKRDKGDKGDKGGNGAVPHATLKDLRKSTRHTQQDLAAAFGVGQDTISRLEHRSDMLLSTLRHYIESVGGQLDLVATFPGQPPVIIDQLGDGKRKGAKRRRRAVRALGSP